MREYLLNRVTATWMLLIAATMTVFGMGRGLGFDDPSDAGVAILVVSLIKVRYVILDFMEVRHAPLVMRLGAEIWTVGVCAWLISLFLRMSG